jgi:putative transposase
VTAARALDGAVDRSRVRAGTVAAAAPRARRSCGPDSSEKALVAVVQQAYVCGVATRRVDQLVESLGLRTSRSEVSRICALVDERSRPSAGGR